MKAISVLGSTGSIGTQTLEIVDDFPDRFRVVALTANRNLDLLMEQILRHQPEVVALADGEDVPALRERLAALEPQRRPPRPPEILGGSEGLEAAAAWSTADLVVTGIVGCAGLLPTLAAIRAGKDLALANKETLIAAGPVVLPELEKSGSRLLPADSEHSAIFQCLQGTPYAETARLSTGTPTPGLRRIQLTASGGAFRDWDPADLHKATVADATSHPNWSMGRKIT
ncbi:MAG: 1-deoxy-D-xylulose-5-phosphate reductoisomerase, partial [Cyanobacteriota bacterium]|nr:1-deoxy-D-xylulose-5-phosphate reductoisomerase [Cyanobacteriota bacterium]